MLRIPDIFQSSHTIRSDAVISPPISPSDHIRLLAPLEQLYDRPPPHFVRTSVNPPLRSGPINKHFFRFAPKMFGARARARCATFVAPQTSGTQFRSGRARAHAAPKRFNVKRSDCRATLTLRCGTGVGALKRLSIVTTSKSRLPVHLSTCVHRVY